MCGYVCIYVAKDTISFHIMSIAAVRADRVGGEGETTSRRCLCWATLFKPFFPALPLSLSAAAVVIVAILIAIWLRFFTFLAVVVGVLQTINFSACGKRRIANCS